MTRSTTVTSSTTAGRLAITTIYLEMTALPERPVGHPPPGTIVMAAETPTLSFYRYLYNTIGEEYLWFLRRQMADAELAAIIHHPAVDVYVLYFGGVPAGFAELDRRGMPAIELAYFGLLPEFIGRGLGGYFLRWAIHRAWDHRPERVQVHTNNFDHPNALPNYKKQGFRPVRTETVLIEDPRPAGAP